MHQKIEEETGKLPKAGLVTRLIDIPIGKGVITQSHGFSPAELATRLKKFGASYFGSAGPAFLNQLICLEQDTQGLKDFIQREHNAAQERLSVDSPLESYQLRSLRRFALAECAGLLAARFDILPLEASEITHAMQTVLRAWLAEDDHQVNSIQGLRAFQSFLVDHVGKLQNLSAWAANSRETIGYFDQRHGLILLTDRGLKQACCGFNAKDVLKEVKSRGGLFHNDRGLKSKHTIPGLGRLRFYAIRAKFLEQDI